ncbi:MAG: hypothetical protein P4N60_11245 [Verrucomicrobiae bacterium]|nr:hypothetical protein [Verrucomicrobiae bacterium]
MKKLKYIVILAIFSLFGVMIVKSLETVPQTQTVLKSYFVQGAHPSSTNYAELIDTMFYYILATYSNAQQAAVSAAAAQTVWQAVGNMSVTGSGATTTNLVISSSNVSSVTVTNLGNFSINELGSGQVSFSNYRFTVTFANALGGLNYNINYSAPGLYRFQTNSGATYQTTSHTQPMLTTTTSQSSTGFVFNVACYSSLFINGTQIKFTVQ